MKQHVATVAVTCSIMYVTYVRFVDVLYVEVTRQLILPFVTFRLDYCNSVWAGAPQILLEPLQRV